MSRRIQIFDTTLRDGEQAPTIALRPHEKAEIALELERLGVDVVEAGFPGASPGDFEGVRVVAAALDRPIVCAFARAHQDDLAAAAEALSGAHRSRMHVCLGTSPVHMESKLGLGTAEIVARARWAVEYAKARVDEVEFTCEDASRSEPEFLARVCRVAIAAGATIINLPDTVGWTIPARYTALLSEVLRRCPELRQVTLSVHCHDDLGLAVANSLAGIVVGAGQVECTVNGIGERAGNAALEELVVALRVHREHYDVETDVDTTRLASASRLVSDRTGYPVQPNKAVVGANAFAHESGIHQDGILKDARTYQILDPAEVGARLTLPLGKHSGRHAFARACAERGLRLAGEELEAAFRRFKELADQGRGVELDEVLEGVSA